MRVRGLVWMGLAGLLGAPTAAQQVPRGEPGRFEVRGLDFRPDGAWRVKAERVRTWRRQQLEAGNTGALNAARDQDRFLRAAGSEAQVVTGTVFVPVITLAYSNVPVPYSVREFETVLFSPAPGAISRPYSLKTYYEELSGGLISMSGRVFEPVRMDSTDAFYQDGCNGIGVTNTCPNGGRRFGGMLLAALDSISLRPGGDTVWAAFDNDGPDGRPNSGDDDGIVDFVTFLQPTVDGACTTPGIWAHRWVISGWNSGQPYTTRTPRRDGSGQPIPGQFIRVQDYTIQSQVGGATGCSGGEILPIGTVAHETGHAFGLPDLYDTDPAPRTEGIGEWGLMGSGNYTKALSPASFDAWSLVQLGWVALRELTASQVATTGPRQVTDTVFLARASQPRQYFLVENRQAVQSDSAQMAPNYGAKRKLPGLLIWRVDEDRIATGRSSNKVNTGAVQGVGLMQADGLNQLRTPGSRNRGDTGDSYPGSTGNRRFSLASNPPARTNDGDFAGFAIDRIEQLPAGVMRFRFIKEQPSVVLSSRVGAQVRVNDVTTPRFEDVFAAGDTVHLAADSLQVVLEGRTAYRFLSWSNGRPLAHALVTGTKPDTVEARFTARHRVRVTVDGNGAVLPNPPGNVSEGVLVDEGVQVTLSAAPVAGSLLVGWQGDTVAAGATLRLPMTRPFDVTAVFVVEQQIPVPDATDELLGTAKLTDAQRSYLDQLGNRNGGYDVGDYLALLKRTGAVPSPEVLARLGAASREER